MSSRTPPIAELTLRAIVLGLVLAIVMGAANVYLGLKAGMTVSASIPAAVMAMLILRGVFRHGTILEANQVQTAASAGESLAAGIIFTMPALVLIGVWQRFDTLLTTLIAFSGGLLGILFMIPMRRVFIVAERSELTFPEGVACAKVLGAGQRNADPRAALGVVHGAVLGAVTKLLAGFFHVAKHTLEGAVAVGERVLYLGGDVSPALVAVGLIVRLNVALLVFVGASIAWLVGIPLLGGAAGLDPLDAAWSAWSAKIRYVGVGAMVVGGVASIFDVRAGLVAAVRHLRPGVRGNSSPDDDARDVSPRVVLALAVVATSIVAWVYFRLTGHLAITLITTAIMLVMSFFFTAVASYIVGLVGNSNSPVSGMTITAVLFTGSLLAVLGFSGTEGMVATLGVAAIVCCAACTSGDVCNDLKTGALVGAAPHRQQTMQVLGVAVAALVMAPVLQLLHDNTPGGIGGRELPAPQAGLFASLARGFFGGGEIPKAMVLAGALIGGVVLAIDKWLQHKGSGFRLHVMPVAVGMYLPFGLAPPILVGGLLAHVTARGAAEERVDERLTAGVLFASGVIAGESLTGVGIAGLAAGGIPRVDTGISAALSTPITLVLAAVVLWLFWQQSRPAR